MATYRLEMSRLATKAWTEEEVESAVILHKMISDKHERLSHLNARFRKERTLSAFKGRIQEAKNPNHKHHPIELKWKNYPACQDNALETLSRLLGRNLIHEGGSLWYREELIAIASLRSGPSSDDAIRRRLKDEYGIGRNIESQAKRMQQVISPSHWIWMRFHCNESRKPTLSLQDETSGGSDSDSMVSNPRPRTLTPDILGRSISPLTATHGDTQSFSYPGWNTSDEHEVGFGITMEE